MVTIKVNNLPALASYGSAIMEYSEEYESALNDASERLRIKSQGSQSEAVSLYLEKLELLRNQVFHIFPSTVKDFGFNVRCYQQTLHGLGFDMKAWTDGGGSHSVESILTGQQVSILDEKAQEMQKALDEATEALGIDRQSLSKSISDAENGLNEAAKIRRNLYTSMDDAYHQFTQALIVNLQQFTSLKYAVSNAKHIHSLDPTAVFKGIASGVIDKTAIDNIEFIQDTGDSAMFLALYSKQPYQLMGQADPTHVSEQMMNLVFGKLFDNVPVEVLNGKTISSTDSKGLKNIEDFLYYLSLQQQDKVKIYSEKLLRSADQTSAGYLSEAEEIRAKFPKDSKASVDDFRTYISQREAAREKLIEIDGNLKLVGTLSSLFESAYLTDLGKIDSHIGSKYYGAVLKRDSLTLSLNEEHGREFRFTMMIFPDGGHLKKVKSEYYTDSDHLSSKIEEKKISELRKKRETYMRNFWVDIVNGSTDLLPGGSTVKSILKVTAGAVANELKEKNLGEQIGSGMSTGSKLSSHESGVSFAGKSVQAMSEWYRFATKNEQELTELIKNYNSKSFDSGGAVTKFNKETISASYTPQYDLQTYLAMQDLRENGMKSYVFEKVLGNNATPTDEIVQRAKREILEFEHMVDQSKLDIENHYTNNVKRVLKGEWAEFYNTQKGGYSSESLNDLIQGIKSSTYKLNAADSVYPRDSEKLLNEFNDRFTDYLGEKR